MNPPSDSSLETIVQRHPSLVGCIFAIVGVVVATALLCIARHYLDAGDESLLYLPIVIGVALRFGFWPAALGALFSFCCWDYFFDVPYYALTISNAHDCISLVIYLAVAVTIARLTSRAKVRTREAEARERDTAMLYKASSAISCEVDADRLLMTLVEQIVYLCGASRCIVYLWNTDTRVLNIAAQSCVNAETSFDEKTISHTAMIAMNQDQIYRVKSIGLSTDLFVPLDVHGRTVGILFVAAGPDGTLRTAQEERMIMTLSNHAAVVIARQIMAEEAREQARQTAVLDERNRLARDVHDTLSHAFTGIKFLLEAANRIDSPQQSQTCIIQARNLAIEGAQEARRSVLALRPVALEEAGNLVEAIRKFVDQKSAEVKPHLEAKFIGSVKALRPSIEENLLRICQEAVSNAIRHADASRIDVTLRFTAKAVILSVGDNGKGFDPLAVDSGFGLTSMRERTALIGGTISIIPSKTDGTEVVVRAPIQPEVVK
jgi:signal transduction histidine kinase